uniref:Uncharacterized protein n=1 Tax=Setaria italica TaxID=4555 RepID=K3ZZ17_SETIT
MNDQINGKFLDQHNGKRWYSNTEQVMETLLKDALMQGTMVQLRKEHFHHS